MTKSKTSSVDLAVAINDIMIIKQDVRDIKDKLENDYVTQIEFDATIQRICEKYDPVTNVVYGMVGLILVIVVTALVYLVVVIK